MKKLLAVAAGMLVLTSGAALAGAPGGGPKANGGVSWIGGAQNQFEVFLSFNAQGDTDDAKGRFNLRNMTNGTQLRGDVTCYFQEGTEARFSGPIDAKDATASASYFVATVEDNAEPGAGADRVYTNAYADPQDCTENADAAKTIQDGNIQIHS